MQIRINKVKPIVINRQLGLHEIFLYVTACAMTIGAFTTLSQPDVTSTLIKMLAISVMIVFPGLLVGGSIGFAILGRKWFIPAALVGMCLWILVVPFIQIAKE